MLSFISGLLGAVIGALIAWFTWWKSSRANTAKELLSEALAIQALKEAWILELPQNEQRKLSSNKNISTKQSGNDFWLRKVELRTVLDEAKWNSPANQEYRFIEGRRTWIVRDQIIKNQYSYKTGQNVSGYPGVISSRAMEELCGWINRVALSCSGFWMSRQLSSHGIVMLSPLIDAVAADDRIEVFGIRITEKAKSFLKKYQKKYLKKQVISDQNI